MVLFASSTASLGVRKVMRREHGAEDLFLRDGGGGVNAGQQRGREVEAVLRQRGLRLPAGCAVGDALVHVATDAFELYGCDDGADVDGLVQWRADAQSLHARADLGVEGFGDALLHEQARAGAADLALVEPDAIDEAFDGGVDVGVVKDDEGRFAAEFEREFFGGVGGGLADDAAYFGRAGEGDLVDVVDARPAARRCGRRR